MSDKIYRGLVSFVQYEKHFATIEYKDGSKSKSVNCKTNVAADGQKPHYFRVGDEVNFRLRLSDRGDKMTAFDIRFLYNAGLDKLVQKARVENKFTGYLKKVDDQLFIKEMETYLFFPLKLSPWENHPGEQTCNAPVTFKLVQLDKPKQISASLYFQVYKPEYRMAKLAFENKERLSATVIKVSAYAVYVSLYNGVITSKINLPSGNLSSVKEGDVIVVEITYLGEERIVVQPI